MAAACEFSNLNISLRALHAINDLFIYPLGRHGTNTYYTVCTFECKAILTVEVLEPGIQITVKNMDKVLVLVGHNGLHDIGSTMAIHSSTNICDKRFAFIDGLKLYDHTEGDPQLQFLMERTNHDPYLVKVAQKKDLLQPGDRFPKLTDFTIKANPRSSAIVVHYAPLLTTPLKKAILMMAALKLYYCMYNFNQHPIPRGIPSQMRPIPPQPPSLNMLRSCSEVKLRFAFRGKDNLFFLELFHGTTFELFLIAEATFKDDNAKMGVIFKDVIGVPQFRLHAQSSACTIFDSFNEIIGMITATTYNNSNRQQYGSKQMVLQNRSHYHNQVFHLFFGQLGIPDGEFNMNSLMNILELRIRQDVGVHLKALVLADAVSAAIKVYRILRHGYHPAANAYPYRKQ